MLTMDQILKSARLENQTGGDDRDFFEPHYNTPSYPNCIPKKCFSKENKKDNKKIIYSAPKQS